MRAGGAQGCKAAGRGVEASARQRRPGTGHAAAPWSGERQMVQTARGRGGAGASVRETGRREGRRAGSGRTVHEAAASGRTKGGEVCRTSSARRARERSGRTGGDTTHQARVEHLLWPAVGRNQRRSSVSAQTTAVEERGSRAGRGKGRTEADADALALVAHRDELARLARLGLQARQAGLGPRVAALSEVAVRGEGDG